MTFAHPLLALAAMASVALPIAIHLLFRRRRTPVEWAAMDLLREAVRRTNRRTRLEQWTLLALRSILVLAAGLAIAVPLSSGLVGPLGQRTTWMVVIDDGATSGLREGLAANTGAVKSPRELDRILDEVRSALAARGGSDRIGIVTASARPRIMLAPTGDYGEVERVLSRIEPSEAPSDLAGAIDLARGVLQGDSPGESAAADESDAGSRRMLVASGFRKGALAEGMLLGRVDAAETGTDPSIESVAPTRGDIEFLATAPSGEEPVDPRIRGIEARVLPSGEALAVRATLSRAGRDLRDGETKVRAEADGFTTPAQRMVRWESGQTEATVEFQLVRDSRDGAARARRRGVRVEIDDDALRAGNAAFSVIDVRPEIEVGIVGRRGSLDAADLDKIPASLWVARALAPSSGGGLRVREIDPSSCDARALLGLDAIVVARPDLLASASMDAIAAFVRGGGLAVVLPAGEAVSQAWGAELLPRLGVSARIAADVKVSEDPRRLADEQPRSALLSTVRPELDALASPVEVTRFLAIEGVSSGEVILTFADGAPFVVAQVPQAIPALREVDSGGAGSTDTADSTGVSSSDADPRAGVLGTDRGGSASIGNSGSASGGLVVLFASAPELAWTNLPVKPLMVPLLQETVRSGLQIAASRDEVSVGSTVAAIPLSILRGPDGATISVLADGRSSEVVRSAGIWRGDTGAVVAANIREDSIALAPRPIEAVRAAFAPLGGVRMAMPSAGDAGGASDEPALGTAASAFSKWSFPLLVVALAALLIEGMLSRLFSHLSAARASGVVARSATAGRRRVRMSSSGSPSSPSGAEIDASIAQPATVRIRAGSETLGGGVR